MTFIKNFIRKNKFKILMTFFILLLIIAILLLHNLMFYCVDLDPFRVLLKFLVGPRGTELFSIRNIPGFTSSDFLLSVIDDRSILVARGEIYIVEGVLDLFFKILQAYYGKCFVLGGGAFSLLVLILSGWGLMVTLTFLLVLALWVLISVARILIFVFLGGLLGEGHMVAAFIIPLIDHLTEYYWREPVFCAITLDEIRNCDYELPRLLLRCYRNWVLHYLSSESWCFQFKMYFLHEFVKFCLTLAEFASQFQEPASKLLVVFVGVFALLKNLILGVCGLLGLICALVYGVVMGVLNFVIRVLIFPLTYIHVWTIHDFTLYCCAPLLDLISLVLDILSTIFNKIANDTFKDVPENITIFGQEVPSSVLWDEEMPIVTSPDEIPLPVWLDDILTHLRNACSLFYNDVAKKNILEFFSYYKLPSDDSFHDVIEPEFMCNCVISEAEWEFLVFCASFLLGNDTLNYIVYAYGLLVWGFTVGIYSAIEGTFSCLSWLLLVHVKCFSNISFSSKLLDFNPTLLQLYKDILTDAMGYLASDDYYMYRWGWSLSNSEIWIITPFYPPRTFCGDSYVYMQSIQLGYDSIGYLPYFAFMDTVYSAYTWLKWTVLFLIFFGFSSWYFLVGFLSFGLIGLMRIQSCAYRELRIRALSVCLQFAFCIAMLVVRPWFLCGMDSDGNYISNFSNGVSAEWTLGESFTLIGYSVYVYIDSISLCFLMLTAVIVPITILLTWDTVDISKLKYYLVSILLVELFLLLAFTTHDMLFFFIAFESILMPVVILIFYIGSRAERIKAAIWFFLFTSVGSVALLFVICMLYNQFNTTDITFISGVLSEHPNLLSLETRRLYCLLMLLAFSIKLPIFPFHVWLPEAHVEAPTGGSVLLAALLLKLGGYGIIRFLVNPLFSSVLVWWGYVFIPLCLAGTIYALCAALKQLDLKRMVAYSSVAHMNYTAVGLFLCTKDSIIGATYSMISHGLISAAFFGLLGILYARYGVKSVVDYRGLSQTMPFFSFYIIVFSLANAGFPVLSSAFSAELIISMSLIKFSLWYIIPIWFIVILNGVYPFWLITRILFGVVSKEDSCDANSRNFIDMNYREFLTMGFLLLLVLILGIFPTWLSSFISLSFVGLF